MSLYKRHLLILARISKQVGLLFGSMVSKAVSDICQDFLIESPTLG